ncbi:uncharacterized protein LOC133328169 [Musca vetustissima]|uniref:uncharacterized protein LOC133328169 n=1 Tax=Musca vetustissima TaxID=27455 RepID=UPI002AB7E79A|nr:uncharacterized protein LOC133328169 [Musca vetustissima]
MARQPKNLQDLLKLAIRYQTNEDCGPSKYEEMDPEKKEFLEKVLKSMTVDVMDELAKAIQLLEDPATSDEDKVEALDIVRDYIDNMDFANSFVKLGGTDILIKCIKSDVVPLRTNAIKVLAEMSQNNVYCQQHFVENNIVEHLISYLQDKDQEVVASALYALSSLMQNYEPATVEFTKHGGIAGVQHCLGSLNSRVFVKSCFLISSISSQFPKICDEFVSAKTFSKLCENLECVGDFDIKIEALLNAMATLTDSSKFDAKTEASNEITPVLDSMLKNIKGLPQCEEMEAYTRKIQEKLK